MKVCVECCKKMQENNYELKTTVNTCIAPTLGENDTLISETEPLQDLNLRDIIQQCMAEETKRFHNIFGLLNDHIIHLQKVIDRKTSLVEELVAE